MHALRASNHAICGMTMIFACISERLFFDWFSKTPRILVTLSRSVTVTVVFENWRVAFGNWRWYAGKGIRKLEVVFGNWKVVFGNWTVVYSETGQWHSETRRWYSETRNPAFGNWELYSAKQKSDFQKPGVVFGNYYSETGTLKLGNFRDTNTERWCEFSTIRWVLQWWSLMKICWS